MPNPKPGQLTDEEIQGILSASGLGMLLGTFVNRIGKRKDTVLACPVGDEKEFRAFEKYVKETGIADVADFVFIHRIGMKIPESGLSALHAIELSPLGTCGAFFAAQSLCYHLGYEVIVLSDINAFLDSKEGFISCRDLVLSSGKAVLPIVYQGENKMIGNNVYNPNSFGFFPRAVFEKVGFSAPYLWRGGEDYEFRSRLLKLDMALLTDKAYVRHPMEGFTIYHKMVAKRKYYPYVSGLILAFLLEAGYRKSSYAKYAVWRMFYAFFADVFNDVQLKEIARNSNKFTIGDWIAEGGSPVAIEKRESTLKFNPSFLARALSMPFSLLSLLAYKRYDTLDERVVLKESRGRLLLGIVWATVMSPIRLCQTALSLFGWNAELKKIAFPITPKNHKEAARIYAGLLKNKRL
jgi:hypothetical protein